MSTRFGQCSVKAPVDAGLVVSLNDLATDARARAGGKAVNLGVMICAGLPVPGGFCVTTNAYRDWFSIARGASVVLSHLEVLRAEQIQGIHSLTAELGLILASHPMPIPVAQAIANALRSMGSDLNWAVRSSATTEDRPEASFAGQHDTFLNVRGEAAILEAVRQCWISLFTDRAVVYRLKHRITQQSVAMGVIVQVMVPSTTAGILFTADPTTGNRERMILEGASGLGDAVVSGRIKPDRLVLERDTMRIIESSSTAVEAGDQGSVAGARRGDYGLDERLATQLGTLGLAVERLFGLPQDIEWAVADGRVWLLQARPITTLGPSTQPQETAPVHPSCFDEQQNRLGRTLAPPTQEGRSPCRTDASSWMGSTCCFTPIGTMNPLVGGGYPRAEAECLSPGSDVPAPSQNNADSWENRQVWSNLNTGEVAPDVMTPITWSLIHSWLRPLAHKAFRAAGADFDRAQGASLVAGRIYFNVNTVLALARPFKFLVRRIPNLAQSLGGGQLHLIEQGKLVIRDEDLPDLGFRWPKYILSWPIVLYDLISHSPRRGEAWRQSVKATNNRVQDLELDTMATPELARTFSSLLQEGLKNCDLLYLATQGIALLFFQKACRDWLDDPHLTLGYQLFSGMGGLPETEAALTLWRLAALAHADPETERILLSSGPWSQALAQLGSLDHGRQFLTAWAQFMSEHGHHCRGELELNNARWSENPDYILDLVRGYLRTIDHADPVAKQERLARERLELTAACRARLKNPVKRWIFTWSLKQSQRLAFNREEWKNQAVRFLTFLRRILLELGERLHRDGVLAQRDDIFFLELSEIEPVAAGRAPFDIPSTICSRRRDYDRNLPLRPPPVVVGRYDPITPSEQETSADQDTLTGIPVFPGVVTGSARVILRTDDHEHLQPGEILVAPFTDPAWTPYFVTAAGVVIDQGGILSHGSIVAREYGLPTVTNVGNATRLIRTGDHVQVDGGSGRVRIVRRV